ncbi:hypothetical protein [Sphingomonas sp. MMS24-J13]|uniref:hypothetical protein n=1 Tax=Sphingomonas sp. MMS24-J13 TaxID=3238686 RepID=UPI00384BA1A3
MRKFTLAAMAIMVAAPAVLPAPSFAQDRAYRDRDYRGQDRSYYNERCKKSSGTTGAVAGGVGGAVVGNALGGGLLGTLAGAGGGALLGRHLDKKHDAAQNRKNGC